MLIQKATRICSDKKILDEQLNVIFKEVDIVLSTTYVK